MNEGNVEGDEVRCRERDSGLDFIPTCAGKLLGGGEQGDDIIGYNLSTL